MNLLAFDSLPENSSGPRGGREEQFLGIREVGFEGVQFVRPATGNELSICRSLGLGYVGSGRVNTPNEIFPIAEAMASDEYECATIHAGWGLEDDKEAHRLIESILEASARTGLTLYLEIHRATICQDMWRTVGFVKRFPELRLNGDFAHWYTGLEMVYGDFESKFAFIKPVLERVRFLHGRISNPGCIQVPVAEGTTYLAHFERLWTTCFRSYIQNETAELPFYFAPELLSADIYYARTINGEEECDRWQESLLLNEIARRCFQRAKTA
jgi:hypothetical protein